MLPQSGLCMGTSWDETSLARSHIRGLGTSLASLACNATMPENVPIMLALCSMLARPYYAPNYSAGIIRPSLVYALDHFSWRYPSRLPPRALSVYFREYTWGPGSLGNRGARALRSREQWQFLCSGIRARPID